MPSTREPQGESRVAFYTSTALLTQEMYNGYGAVAGATAGIHTDPTYAAQTEFGGVVAQGMLLTSLVAEHVERRAPTWRASGDLDLRFLSPASPGQTFEINDYGPEDAFGGSVTAEIAGTVVGSGSWTLPGCSGSGSAGRSQYRNVAMNWRMAQRDVAACLRNAPADRLGRST